MSSATSNASTEKLAKKYQDPPEDRTSTTEMPTDLAKQEAETQSDLEKQEEPKKTEEPQYLTGVKLWSMMSGVILVVFLMLMDISIVSTATPKITSDFHSLSNVGWYGAAYQLSAATLQPLTGKVYTQFDLKWTFFAFFILFEFGSLLCGVATSSNMLIVGRAVAGMGGSGLQNGGLTIINAAAPMPKRPTLLGAVFGFGQLGLIAGPLFGGLLTQYASWRWCFYINLPVGAVVAALLVFLRIPDQVSKPPPRTVLPTLHKKLDLVGFALFAPASIMVLLAVQWGGNQYEWNSSIVIGVLVGGVAAAGVWAVWNNFKHDAALIPFPMLRKRHVWSSCLVGGFFGAAMFCNSYYLPIYFQGVRNRSPAVSGVYLLPSILSQLIFAVLGGKLISMFGYYLPFSVIGSALQVIGYGLQSTFDPQTSSGEWIGYQIVGGAGRGIGIQVPFLSIQNNLSPTEMPVAMALLVTAQTYFGALFLSFGGTLFTNSLRSLLGNFLSETRADSIAHAGAYGFRDVVPDGELASVLRAYATSIDRVFYMMIGLAGLCFVFSFFLGWVDIRKKPTSEAKAKDDTKEEHV